jgi:TonB-like protein
VPCPLRSDPPLVSLCLSPGLAAAAWAAGTGRAAQRWFSNRVVDEPVHVSQEVMQGLLIKKLAPNYPALALQARIGGAVILNVEISRSGDVVNTSLFSGHPMPAAAAVRS